jgi:lambda repressor-like predicted transcriptional regulator
MNQKNNASRALATIDLKGTDQPATKSRGTDVAGIIEEEHNKYLIKAGRLGGTYVARAFPKPPSKAQGVFAEAEGDSYQAAVAALKSVIEARDIQREAVRRWDENASVSVPNEEEYVEALYQTSLSRPQIAMLKAHSFARDEGMTLDQLARAAGYKSRETAGKVFRKAGDIIADYLGIDVTEDAVPGRDGATLILAFQYIQGEDVPTVWIMHPELRDAVQVAL